MVFQKMLPYAASALLVFFMFAFLLFPARCAEYMLEGISLWAFNVLPVLFPFLLIASLFSSLPLYTRFCGKLSPFFSKVFRVSGAGGGAMLLSALSGYPAGAKTVLELYEKNLVSKEETARLARICSTSGPMFFVGTVGVLFQSPALGAVMLFSHLVSVYAVGFFLKPKRPIAKAVMPPKNQVDFFGALWQAIVSILCVGASISLFYTLGELLSDLGLFSMLNRVIPGGYAEAVLRGLLEMTTGCYLLSRNANALSCALACALVTFGGFCVLFQQAVYLTKAGVNMPRFVLVKFIQAVVAFFVCLFLCALSGV